MRLLRDPDELARLIDLNAPPGFMGDTTAAQWLANPCRFALSDGDDLGLFEAGDDWPGPLCAHVMFSSRGRKALTVARTMLEQAFAFGATRILGETPVEFRHATLFARKLGFVPYGEGENKGKRVILSALEPGALHNCLPDKIMAM